MGRSFDERTFLFTKHTDFLKIKYKNVEYLNLMAQFVLKIEKLSHIIGSTPILEMECFYGLRP